MTKISISVPDELAEQLPVEPAERQAVLALGLKEWRIRRALERYERGEGSLAYAAQQAGISLREMIPLAYAHGLTPKVEAGWLSGDPLSLDDAARL
jgi:hypothetical protein